MREKWVGRQRAYMSTGRALKPNWSTYVITAVWNKTVDNLEDKVPACAFGGDSHCWYCGELFVLTHEKGLMYSRVVRPRNFTIDHADPLGGDYLDNLLPACRRCNIRKGARNIEAYRYWLSEVVGKHNKVVFFGETLIPF